MDAQKLRSIPLFSSLKRGELDRLARVTDEVDVPSGTLLMHEGDFAHDFMIIEEGEAEVRRSDSGEHVADLGPGDFFGEVAALGEGRRNADVMAKSEMCLVVMTRRALRDVASSSPELDRTLRAAIDERHPIAQCA